jgi:hypothetical protein
MIVFVCIYVYKIDFLHDCIQHIVVRGIQISRVTYSTKFVDCTYDSTFHFLSCSQFPSLFLSAALQDESREYLVQVIPGGRRNTKGSIKLSYSLVPPPASSV